LVPEVDVQFPIAVTIDGTAPKPGAVFISDSAIGTHAISVPSTQGIDFFTRLGFDHWKDGSTDISRTPSLQNATTPSVLYVTQLRLSLEISQVNATAAGW
jgi:hypothetical protein